MTIWVRVQVGRDPQRRIFSHRGVRSGHWDEFRWTPPAPFWGSDAGGVKELWGLGGGGVGIVDYDP